jgi:hypothetical protein
MKKNINILVIVENQKGHVNEILYNENLVLSNLLKKEISLHFWGPGYDFKTNDIIEKLKELKTKNINIDIIYINIVHKFLINKYDYSSLPKNFVEKKFDFFPLNLDKVIIPKILLIVDFWQLNKYEWEILFRRNKIDYVFSAHLNFELRDDFNKKFLTKYTKTNIKFFQYFRTLNENISLKKSKKIYDVVILGENWERFYPNRKKFTNEIEVLKEKGNLTLFTNKHPGYVYVDDKKKITGKNYFKILSKSKVMVTDSTYFGTHLIKTIECLKYNCVYVTDKIYNPTYNFLKNEYNYYEVGSHSIADKIMKLINDKKKLNFISKNGHRTYSKFYSNKVFSKNMMKLFLKIISKEKTNNLDKDNYYTPIYALKIMSCIIKIKIFFLAVYYKIFNIRKFPI